MSEQLLDLLRLGLLALIYLFFLRVMWTVTTEIRHPRGDPRSRGRGARPPRRSAPRATAPARVGGVRALRLVEPTELAGVEYPMGGEMTLGRAAGCGVVLDDTFVSQVHARIGVEAGTARLEDLGSTNGSYHNGDRVESPVALRPGDRLQFGATILEVV